MTGLGTGGADMAVVVALTSSGDVLVRNAIAVVEYLERQTVSPSLEVCLVAVAPPSAGDPAEPDPGAEDIRRALTPYESAFRSIAVVDPGPVHTVPEAVAAAVPRTEAPVVALLEDHAFPAPDWAEGLLRAMQGPWTAVGCVMDNANPASALSWANLLLAYGAWVGPRQPEETDDIAAHNVAYRREVLTELGAELVQALERGSTLHQRLRQRGGRFFLSDVAVAHVNPSRLSSTVRLRFHAGRLFGAQRAARNGWPTWRKLVYASAAAVIPGLRLWRTRHLLLPRTARDRSGPMLLPAVILGLSCEAVGEATGYLTGSGASPEILEAFEFGRWRHLRPSDREALLGAPAKLGAEGGPAH